VVDFKKLVGLALHYCRLSSESRTYYSNKLLQGGPPSNTLLFIEGGEAVFELQGARVVCKKNDLICWGEEHLKESYPAPGTRLSYILISFDLLSVGGERLKLSKSDVPWLFHLKKPRPIRLLLHQIHDAFNSREDNRLPRCSMLGLRLLLVLDDLKRARKGLHDFVGGRLHYRIRECLEYLHENYKKKLGLKTLAWKACMTPNAFARLFKKQIGMSPYQYALTYKVEKAKDFLLHFDEPLIYTCNELGFHDYSHFYHAFKKVTGMTPSQFIKNSRKGYDPR
jgi:AraC-like DNA-binding protein